MSYFLFIANLAVIALLIYWSYKKSQASPLKKFFWPALIMKLLAGILLGIIYRYYYEFGDTWQYFKEGIRLASITEISIWEYLREIFFNSADYTSQFDRQPRALFISKITSCFVLLTGGNYWLISLYFSFLSFLGFWFLANKLAQVFSNKTAIVLSLLFFPSVVFWSSGLSKESLAMMAITIMSAYIIIFFYNLKRINLKDIVLLILAFILLWKVKYFYAGAMILSFGSGLLVYLISRKILSIKVKWHWLLLSFVVILVVLTVIVSFSRYNFQFDNLPDVITKNYQAYVSKSSEEQMVVFEGLESTWASIAIHSPKALFSGLFRPLPGDGSSSLSWLASIENVFLIILAFTALFGGSLSWDFKERILLISSILFVSILAVFLTLSSPNFGTLTRYKIGFLPFFLLIITVSNPLIKKANKWLFGE